MLLRNLLELEDELFFCVDDAERTLHSANDEWINVKRLILDAAARGIGRLL